MMSVKLNTAGVLLSKVIITFRSSLFCHDTPARLEFISLSSYSCGTAYLSCCFSLHTLDSLGITELMVPFICTYTETETETETETKHARARARESPETGSRGSGGW
ncbi:hypothetical protein VPH35_043111 [Triticum aestivum]